jgi:P-type conjugative transfer protein TrbJ
MKSIRRKNAAAAAAMLGVVVLLSPGRAQAQWIVNDPLNTIQGTITAGSHVLSYAEQLTQYAKQVQQYETQLQQYQTQLQNLQALGNFKWADASTSLDQLVGTVNGTAGAYNAFLSQFKPQALWNQLPPTVSAFRQSVVASSATEIAAYAATVQNLATQNASMAHDAAVLSKMTASAQGVTGQLQALQAGMQLASAQVAQLQQMRGLLLHLADVTTARNASLANKEAAEAAATQNGMRVDPGAYTAATLDTSMR